MTGRRVPSTRVSQELFARARSVIPGGVNSPVRAFRSVGGTPRFIAAAQGAHVLDVDGNRYVDYVGSWGPMILGHARPEIVAAAEEALRRGSSFGAPTEAEVELAEAIVEAVPGVDMVRCVSSGTEATMSAIRLARGVTQRPRILKFAGHYHGHADSLLASAGSGVATFGLPDSPGVTRGSAGDTLVAAWNDADAVRGAFAAAGETIAAVICEPVPGNMGVVPALPGFLELLRAITRDHGAVLILDEVMSGFRVARGGASEHYGVTADLVTLGKVIGGGYPLAAFGGRADIMRQLAPEGPVYQAGTLSGNPVAVAAGLTQLRLLDAEAYKGLEQRADRLRGGLLAAFAEAGVAVQIPAVASMFSVFFTSRPVHDFQVAKAADHGRYARFFNAMLARGHYFPPSGYEAIFVSLAHTTGDIDATIAAARELAPDLAD
ncbi:MAG: glutamate-1-semialdehyde 2,1-aminomutase [Nitriliruptorales bacterium]|nr:glutamate-1-semialdehyde 2,1-aminomutase [Nitriliruptorales bacterium]